MSQYNDSHVGTFTAGAALGANIRVKLSSGKVVAAGVADHDAYLGTTTHAVFADGDRVGVRFRNAPGTRKVVAATSFSAGAALYTAADGKVDDATPTGASKCFIALEAAGAANVVVEALPINI